MTTEYLENVGLDGYVGEELPVSMYELIACFREFFNYLRIHTLIMFYKQHMIKKTSWTLLDFIQSLLIFVA